MTTLRDLVVAYELPSERPRTRPARLLQGFLEPVQESVVEGSLEAGKVDRLRSAIEGVVESNEDSVCIHRLCRRCRELTEVLGLGVQIQEDRSDIIL